MLVRRARHVTNIKLLLTAAFAVCCAAAGALAQVTPRYTVTDLGAFTPYGVSELGQVAGYAVIDGRGSAVFHDGAFKTINPPGASSSEARAVNGHGQVAGMALFCDIPPDGTCQNSRWRAFVYRQGAFTILGTLGGNNSFSGDINDAGLITGYSSTLMTSGDTQAFSSGGGSLENIGAKMGVANSTASAVNAVGQIAGNHSIDHRAGVFIYDTRDGTFSLFPITGIADRLNDLGQVVGGLSGNDDGSGRAFLLAGGVVKDLGTLMPSHRFSRARSLNNAGQIVGTSSTNFFTHGDERAFLYEGGVMLDLNALIPAGSGWSLKEATDINGGGQIVGRGTLNGEERAFMLTPTQPVLLTEPDSTTALALDSVTFERGPFTLSSPHNFSADGRRRLTLLARNVEFAPGEDVQQLSVRAESATGETHVLPVEHVGRMPGFPSLTQITVRLSDGLNAGGDFRLSLSFRGAASNKATLSISAF